MSLASFVFQFIVVYSNRFPRQSWKSPQIHVESLATAMVTLQLLQFVLYHARPGGGNHWPVRWGAWAAYYLPVPVAALAVATMLRSPSSRCPPPYWLVVIFFAAGQADTMAAYSLRDGDKQGVRRFAKRALIFAYLALVLFHRGDDGAPTTTTLGSLRRKEKVSLVLGFLAVLQDLKISRRATVPPSEICKFVADHERSEAQRRRREAPPPLFADAGDEPQQDRPSVVAVGSLESYRSAVSGCTTLEDTRLRTSTGCCSRRLEDACLSSALFLELLQRYGGHGYGQVAERSSANRAFTDVLADEERWWGWDDRAFQVVKVQLSFMRDYFFSAHGSGSPSRTSYRLYVVCYLLKISFLLSVLSLVNGEEEKPRRSTSASLYALLLLQLCQFLGYLNSDRFLVSYMCDRRGDLSDIVEAAPLSSTDSIFVAIPMFLFEVLVGHEPKVHLGHYSLVEDFDRTGAGTRLMQGLMTRLLGRRRPQLQSQQRGAPLFNYKQIKTSIRSENKSSQFHMLKRWICDKAVIDSESSSQPRRPRSFSFDDQSMLVCDSLGFRVAWTLQQETGIHTILIWHIATWFCDMSLEDAKFLAVEKVCPGAYTFATMLSSYCAYLVAKHPELLHEHPSLTRSVVLDQVVEEAKLWFKAGTSSAEERYEMMKSCSLELMIDYPSHFRGLLPQGIKLGHQLMIHSISERWEIMADFWAEMVLFVAGSGNAAAHIEHLARGDEFVTQLWALLSNVWDRTSIRRDNDYDHSSEVLRRFCGIVFEALS